MEKPPFVCIICGKRAHSGSCDQKVLDKIDAARKGAGNRETLPRIYGYGKTYDERLQDAWEMQDMEK